MKSRSIHHPLLCANDAIVINTNKNPKERMAYLVKFLVLEPYRFFVIN